MCVLAVVACDGGEPADPDFDPNETATSTDSDDDGSTGGTSGGSADSGQDSTTDADPSASTTSAGTSSASTTGSASTDTGETGSSSGDFTTGSSETSDSGGAECQELEACCDQLGADIYTGCITVVDMGNAGLCQQILSTYHGDGYCTGETYCLELGQCCSELPPGVGWADTCNYYADLGNQPQCAMLISDYQLSNYCL